MLLTKKSEYALLSLVIIAQSKNPQNVDQLSTDLNISKSFLAKILQNLAKNGILNSYKGNNGGFTLNKPYDKLTILEITKIAEQKYPAVFDCTTPNGMCHGSVHGKCTIFPLLSNLQLKINDFLNQLTLKDIIEVE